MAKTPNPKTVETLKHDEATRKNIPTAEFQSVLDKEQQDPKKVRYPRNTDLDPQLVWRGKDEQDWSDLVVHAPPLYIQEKVHPKALMICCARPRSASTKRDRLRLTCSPISTAFPKARTRRNSISTTRTGRTA